MRRTPATLHLLRVTKPAEEAAPRDAPPLDPALERAPALDDTELLAAVRRGDRSSAGSIYRRARQPMERTIAHLLGASDPDAEDLVQLSAIELVRSLGRFRGECSLDTWIARVTAHTVYKELRRRRSGRRLRAAVREIEETGPRSATFGRAIELRDVVDRVQAHLDTLEPTKAWTVLLHDVCGYDLREISEITEASVAAAQTRLVRGRAELHAKIAADPSLARALELDAEDGR